VIDSLSLTNGGQMNKLEKNKIDFIIDEAGKLMLKSSISEVTMKVLANDIGIGEATLYRYFGRKENIVINAAIMMWKDISKNYFENIGSTENLTGIECVRKYWEVFQKLYDTNANFLLFIKDFDNYVQTSGMNVNQLREYNDLFAQLEHRFSEYYLKGVKDKTIRGDIDPQIYYFAASHSIQNLAIKLAGRPIIEVDEKIDHDQQIKMAIDAFILLITPKE